MEIFCAKKVEIPDWNTSVPLRPNQLKHVEKRRITIADWLTHLTTEVGAPGSSLPGVPFQFYLKCFSHLLQSTAKVKRLTINPQFLCVILVDNQFIRRYSESPENEL